MNISLTKKEYRALIDMLYLADWMMNSHASDPEEYHREHQALRKKLLSYSKEMEADDIIEYVEDLNDYYETKDYDDQLHEMFIDTYDDETFWDELLSRLAERDLLKTIGIEKYKSMEGIDRVIQVEELREIYAIEFENHGLEHVKVECMESTKQLHKKDKMIKSGKNKLSNMDA